MANNNGIFNAAMAGAMAAFTSRWITDINSSFYSQQVMVAKAFATQIDSLIATSGSYTSASFRLMESMCNAFWKDRDPTDLNPVAYIAGATALRAAFLQANAEMTPESTGATTVNIQTFTDPLAFNLWVKPVNSLFTTVLCMGAGGGGGSGRRGATNTNRFGGGGGGGGGYSIMQVDPATLSANEPAQPGAGGTGGTAIGADDTSGNPGNSGNASSFGQFNTAFCTATGGFGGQGGTSSSGNGGLGGYGQFFGGAGGFGGGGNGTLDGTSAQVGQGPSAGGGGGGAGISSDNFTTGFGGSGGSNLCYSSSFEFGGGGDGGNFVGAVPIPATDGETLIQMNYGGKGAGGGYPSADPGGGTQPAGPGAIGGAGGGGGGGGGASLNGFDSGAGGNGGNGIVVVITICAA